jgi:hypothetical protein
VTSIATIATTAKPIIRAAGPATSSRANLVASCGPVTELKALWKSATIRTLRPAPLYSYMITTRKNTATTAWMAT